MAAAVLGIRFALELCALAALAYWGAEAGSGTLESILLAVAVVALGATYWGLLIAPRAPFRADDPARLVFELIFFAAASGALADAGETALAIALLAVAVADSAALRLLGADIEPRGDAQWQSRRADSNR